jgi:hypothetical protein
MSMPRNLSLKADAQRGGLRLRRGWPASYRWYLELAAIWAWGVRRTLLFFESTSAERVTPSATWRHKVDGAILQ